MPKRPPLLASAVALFMLLLAACGGSSSASTRQIIEITAGERSNALYFTPNEVRVPVGAKVQFVVRNEGKQDHEFESDEARIEEIVVPPDRTRKVNWTAPSQPGRYPAYCDLPGHREAGMELTIIVEQAGRPFPMPERSPRRLVHGATGAGASAPSASWPAAAEGSQ